MKPVVIRWKRDAARVPAASVLLLVVLVGGALMRMTVKERLNERRAAAAALAAHSGSRITNTIALATDLGLCGRDPATLDPIVRAVDAGRVAGSGFDYELSCTPPGGERPRVIARSTGRALTDPVLHVIYGKTGVWTIAVARQHGWLPWRLIAVQSLLVFVTAVFAVLSITALARRPQLLRRELDARDRRLKLVHERLAKEIQQREAIGSQSSQASLADLLAVLPNRAHFIDRVSRAQQRARLDPAAGAAVIVIRLERLTAIEDGRSSTAADELILQAVRRLHGCLGTREHSIARVADEAVGLLLVGVASREAARAEAVLLQQALAQPLSVSGRLVFVHSNMGIALAASGDESAEQLLRAADLALERVIDNYRAATDKVYARGPRRAALAGQPAPVLSAGLV